MKKVLIIDDDHEIHLAMREAVQDQCEMFSAFSGEKGLLLFLQHKPDLVFLDVQLRSVLEGNHVLLFLKKAFPDVPVYVMSGMAHLKNEMLQLGADRFIEKPFNLLEVGNLLASM